MARRRRQVEVASGSLLSAAVRGAESGDGWTMLLGDCRDVLPALEARVAHVITDPPYEEAAHTKQRRIRSAVDGSDWKKKRGAPAFGQDPHAFGKGARAGVEVVPLDFVAIDEETRALAGREFARLASRWVLVFCMAEGAHLWSAAGAAAKLRHVRVGIWDKPDGMPQLTGDRPGTGYEAIEIMHAPGACRWNGGGKRAVWRCPTRWRPELGGGQAYRRGGREGQDDHLTTKPLQLMLDLVDDFTDAGETVLDPFAGSGTTGVACLRRGRRFVGVEREEKYFELAVERLRAEEGGTTLAAARAGQEVLFK